MADSRRDFDCDGCGAMLPDVPAFSANGNRTYCTSYCRTWHEGDAVEEQEAE